MKKRKAASTRSGKVSSSTTLSGSSSDVSARPTPVTSPISPKSPQDEIPISIAFIWQEYLTRTPKALQFVDVYLIFLVLLAIPPFGYMLMVGKVVFHAFASAFIGIVGSFVLTVSLRMTVDPDNVNLFNMTPERAFVDWVTCHFILLFFCASFMD